MRSQLLGGQAHQQLIRRCRGADRRAGQGGSRFPRSAQPSQKARRRGGQLCVIRTQTKGAAHIPEGLLRSAGPLMPQGGQFVPAGIGRLKGGPPRALEGAGCAVHIAARHARQNHMHQPVQPGAPLDGRLPIGLFHFVHVAIPWRGHGLSVIRRIEIEREGVKPLLTVPQGDHILADQPVERHARRIIRQSRKRLAVAGLVAVQLPEGERVAGRAGCVAGVGTGGMALQHRRAAQISRLLAFFRPPQPVGRRALKGIHVDAGHCFLSAPPLRGASRMLMPAPD